MERFTRYGLRSSDGRKMKLVQLVFEGEHRNQARLVGRIYDA